MQAGNKDYILRFKLMGEEIETGLLLYKGEEENFFLYMVQLPNNIIDDIVPSREYIFVVDVSGSMHGFPISISKKLLRQLVNSLRENDRFNIVLFANGTRVMTSESIYATKENVNRSIQYIDKEVVSGGTEMRIAIERALEINKMGNYSRNILIITNGYISFENSIFDLIRSKLDEVNFFAFGIGSSVNRYLIEGIAKGSQTESFIAISKEGAERVAEKFRKYVYAPILTNIDLRFDDFNAYDVEPAKIPALMAKRHLIVYGKWDGNIVGSMVITGKG